MASDRSRSGLHGEDGAGGSDEPIAALMPRGAGHQFVIYGDACSGVPGAQHEETFARVNSIVSRIVPPPEFVLFPGDEIVGLTSDPGVLREQWRYWLDVEMKWLDRRTVPLYHTTSNHTTFDAMSEAVFRDVLGHLPQNGPSDQKGLSYAVRDGDLVIAFVNTMWSGLGGEGHVETEWLSETLHRHRDARHKLVVGHHPAHGVNGYGGACQHTISPDHAAEFWRILVENSVLAYVCSHILAFDVQAHDGVLQITSAGAGTRHRMPEGFEYLHCVQAALDAQGLRYQVIDTSGRVRERLSWPIKLPAADGWIPIEDAKPYPAPMAGEVTSDRIVAWRFRGQAAGRGAVTAQTLLAAISSDSLAPLWVGLRGPRQRLTVVIAAENGRSPHYWQGPELKPSAPFDVQVMIHTGMGPGGILYRRAPDERWSSFGSVSPWGAERLAWPQSWLLGHGRYGPADQPFLGTGLATTMSVQ
jgi:hypothetical protein